MAICLMIQQQKPLTILATDLMTLLENAALLTMQKTGIQKAVDEAEVDVEISLTFTGNEEIQALNAEYRDKDCPTDVLSFPMEDDVLGVLTETEFFEGQNLLLGDIIVSLDRAVEQAKSYGHSMEREICFLFVHGLLHLLGYDHLIESEEQEMRALQTAILLDLGQAR